MKFNKKLNLLFEEVEVGFKVVSIDQANEVLRSDASSFKPQQLIYTFLDEDEYEAADFLVVNPKDRDVTYKKRYHALIMDSLKKWKEFPLRGKGIVATADKEKDTERQIYVVIPYNGAQLGISPKANIFNSFPFVAINLGIKFENFNQSLNVLLNIYNNPEGTYDLKTKKLTINNLQRYDETYDIFRHAIDVLDQQFATPDGQRLFQEITTNPYNKETEDNVISIMQYMNAKDIKLINVINKLFDPYENGFQLLSFENFIVGEHKDHDIWTDSQCLLVKETTFDQLTFEGNEPPQKEPDDDNEFGPEENDFEMANELEPGDDEVEANDTV